MAFFMQCGAMTNAMHCIVHRNALQRATESTAFLGAVAQEQNGIVKKKLNNAYPAEGKLCGLDGICYLCCQNH